MQVEQVWGEGKEFRGGHVAFDMLKTVDMVSDSVTWSAGGTCGKKQMMPVSMGGPAIKCEIMIGGR